jgi:hypothetical protein
MRQSPGAIVSNFYRCNSITIIVVLYRIFSTGLEGEDMHLLYSFMPFVKEPINLLFLGKYDLSHTNATLNLMQSLMIALNEFIHLSLSPVKSSRREFFSLLFSHSLFFNLYVPAFRQKSFYYCFSQYIHLC